jgi:hypothetical protein
MQLLLTDPAQIQADYIAVTYPTGTTETYTYMVGGSSGRTVLVLTITYTDSTKASISSVARTQPTPMNQ